MTLNDYVVLYTFLSWYTSWYDAIISRKVVNASAVKRVILRVELMLTHDELADVMQRVGCTMTEMSYETDDETVIRFTCDKLYGKLYVDVNTSHVKIKRVLLE